MELGFFTRTKTGVIQSRLQNDVGGVSGVLTNTVTSILGNVVTVIASLVAMIIIDWRLTLIAVVMMPFLVIVQRRVGQVRARIAGETQESLSELTAITQETLSVSGILLSKSFNRQRTESARYSDENRQPGAAAGAAGDERPGLLRGRAGAHGERARRHLPRLGLPHHRRHRRDHRRNDRRVHHRAGAAADAAHGPHARRARRADLRRRCSPASSSTSTSCRRSATRPTRSRSRTAPGPIGRIEFRDVVFRYPDAAADARPTLRGISFTAEPGQHVAFVGPSGAGKTTVLYLTPRMYEASGGAVLFAGEDVRRLTQESIIDNVGIVSQETYLFHATIRENLRYAKPEATRGRSSRRRAAPRTSTTSSTGFEEGYDTVVGERGYRLSGGEKQRIAIARVLLKDPPVLLLDEATSALDTVSERVVQEALDAAARGRTTLSIAHRLSTVIGADVIHVVEAGRIVESGTHATLLAAGRALRRARGRSSSRHPGSSRSRRPSRPAHCPTAAPTARRTTRRRCRLDDPVVVLTGSLSLTPAGPGR